MDTKNEAARGEHAVACGHRAVAEAAEEILGGGGNAFDACIAGGLAACVAEPGLTSLGGGGFLLARTAAGEETLFDFFVDAPGAGASEGPDGQAQAPHFHPITVHFPGADQVFNTGHGSAAVPGVLHGYLHVHRRLGRHPLREVVAPAVRLAREGVALNEVQAWVLEILWPILAQTPDCQALFGPAGNPLRPGEHFRNPGYADFLEALAVGRSGDLYHGPLADRIAADMTEADGLITREDLARFRTIERHPLAWTYRGLRVLTNPPPSFGGALLALSLSLLEAKDLSGCAPGSARHALALAEVLREVDRLRAQGVYEPFGLASGGDDPDDDWAERPVFTRGTTHISVSDADGNVASMTTSNGEGSGYVVPGTGILLNNMLGEDDLHPHGFHAAPPGTRVASMMAPTIVVDERGNEPGVALVLGSGGSKRIRTAVLQVLCRRLDLKQPLATAVLAPRLHWTGDRLDVEPGFSPEATRTLTERYPGTNLWSDRNLFFGGVHAVDPREPAAAADVRREGHALLGAGR